MVINPIFSLEVFFAAFMAGLLGSLTGLGGGVVLTPLLVLGLGVPIQYALGTTLVSTISTSSGSASAFVREKISNMKIGLALQVGTTLGAICGSITLYRIERLHLLTIIDVIFGIVLILSTFPNWIKMKTEVPVGIKPDFFAKKLDLSGTYYDEALKRPVEYYGIRYPLGLAGMFLAGYLSGLLGIGSGAFKVIAMDFAMSLPFKVSTATSNFMIGVTAATSAGLYWSLGLIDPVLVASTIPGVLAGSMLGARYLNRLLSRRLRQIFTVVLVALGIELILRGVGLFP